MNAEFGTTESPAENTAIGATAFERAEETARAERTSAITAIVRTAQRYWPELVAALVAFGVYCAFSWRMLLSQSKAPHFVYQAAGFLSGRLSIPGRPPNLNDWVLHDSAWFVSFPPFPAVLMAPFVALNGIGFNDVFFTAILSALNVGLFVALLRTFREAGEFRRTDAELLLLAGFFAFGSVYFYSSIRGEVWFTAHVVGVGLTLLYLLASWRGRFPVVAGLVLGLAAATRANLAFAFPFFVIECLLPAGRFEGWSDLRARMREQRPKLVQFGLAAGAVFVALLAFNHARFGSWAEFGHGLMFNNRVNPRVEQYGLFHPHFLATNLKSAFFLLPKISWSPFSITFNGNGLSMLLTTPLIVLAVFPARRSRMVLPLAITTLCIALPGLLYMNNGWFQFGFRFSNDYLPYLFILLAVGGRRMGKGFIALGLVGVVVSTWGAIVFNR